jgi:chromosomal replication initiation ATPase DnaA
MCAGPTVRSYVRAIDISSWTMQTSLPVTGTVREPDRAVELAGREAPARWNVGLADLASRLKALSGAGISAPDDDLLAALMVKLFRDRQLRVGEDVVLYLMVRMDRSFAAVVDIVAAIDSAALERGRPVTVPLAREILGDFV